MKGRHLPSLVLMFCLAQHALIGQTPTLRDIKKADILFAAQAPPAANDENGKPAFATLEPIAFLAGGKLLDCFDHHSQAAEEVMDKAVRGKLGRWYAPNRSLPLWWRGAPLGRALAVNACFDEELDFNGCFRLNPDDKQIRVPKNFEGTAFTGESPAPSHPALRVKANPGEGSALLKAITAVFAEHHLHFAASRIQVENIWKTQLRSGTSAITGSALVQVPAREPQTYNSYRMLLIAQETNGELVPVLTFFHETKIKLEGGDWPPEPAQEIDEGNDADKEVFFDNFPVFAGEPDAVITRHSYYEDWNFSIYRWVGSSYKLVYTGCGGGA